MHSTPQPFFVAGRPQASAGRLHVPNKHRAGEAGAICLPGEADVQQAFEAAASAADPMRRLPAHRRRDALARIAAGVQSRAEEMARVISAEVGKTIREARTEVARTIDTFRASSEEATRLTGEYLPLDVSTRAEGIEAIVKQVPVGVCSFITPFNFPLNLAAHKVGPAIASGCPFVLKPDPRTPLSSLILGEILADTDLQAGSWSILPVIDDNARDLFVTDPRIRLISFTGSGRVGWDIKARAGHKKVLLELGGNAACIVDAPVSAEAGGVGVHAGGAGVHARHSIDHIADRITTGCFAIAGQSCISVQRILLHRTIAREMTEALIEKARALKQGDPSEESTDLGPLISEEAAKRVEEWIAEAVRRGAKVLTGGKRTGSFLEPTLLSGVPRTAKLNCEEVFGPVGVIQTFDTFDQALALVNASAYGLQAGVFTQNLDHAFRAWNELEVGAVIINDIPTMRVDTMPYGGVKDSGFGREGVRYAIREMTEPRTMVLKSIGRA